MNLLTTMREKRFGTTLADPPWQFQNRTGKVAPEHEQLNRYETVTLGESGARLVANVVADPTYFYL